MQHSLDRPRFGPQNKFKIEIIQRMLLGQLGIKLEAINKENWNPKIHED